MWLLVRNAREAARDEWYISAEAQEGIGAAWLAWEKARIELFAVPTDDSQKKLQKRPAKV